MNANSSRLAGLTNDLWIKWSETKEYWRDMKAREFEQNYLGELRPAVDKTADVIDKLDQLLNKIRKDCE
jgi:hypothetical protein